MEMIVDAGSAAEILHAEDEKRFVIGWKFLRRRLYAAAAHQAIIPASSKELQRYQVGIQLQIGIGYFRRSVM